MTPPNPQEGGKPEVSFLITRANAPDDMLTAVGAYARIDESGRLLVFSGDRMGLGSYEPDDWLAISRPQATGGDNER